MICKRFNARILLAVLSSATLLVGHASAQTNRPVPPDSAAPNVAASPTALKSAFEGYQAYSDDKMTNWRAANDEVARIGGWREYAKQAQELDVKPAGKPASAAKTDVSQPKATP